MSADITRRTALTAAAVPVLATALPIAAALPALAGNNDARLSALGAEWRASEDRFNAFDHDTRSPDDPEIEQCIKHQNAVLEQIALTPAAGLPGLAVKADVLRYSLCENDIGNDSTKAVLVSLLDDIGAVAS